MALNCLVFEKIAFLQFGDRQTDVKMDRPDAWSRSCCREWRLNNVKHIMCRISCYKVLNIRGAFSDFGVSGHWGGSRNITGCRIRSGMYQNNNSTDKNVSHVFTSRWQLSTTWPPSTWPGSRERIDGWIHRRTCRATDNDDQNDEHIDHSPRSGVLAEVALHTQTVTLPTRKAAQPMEV